MEVKSLLLDECDCIAGQAHTCVHDIWQRHTHTDRQCKIHHHLTSVDLRCTYPNTSGNSQPTVVCMHRLA